MTTLRPHAGKTLRLQAPKLSDLDPAAVYVISAAGTEARGRAPLWEDCLRQRAANCVEVVDSSWTTASFRHDTDSPVEVALNDEVALSGIFGDYPAAYVDVSGMSHHVWASLIRAGFSALDTLYVVYTEPSAYKKHPNPT